MSDDCARRWRVCRDLYVSCACLWHTACVFMREWQLTVKPWPVFLVLCAIKHRLAFRKPGNQSVSATSLTHRIRSHPTHLFIIFLWGLATLQGKKTRKKKSKAERGWRENSRYSPKHFQTLSWEKQKRCVSLNKPYFSVSCKKRRSWQTLHALSVLSQLKSALEYIPVGQRGNPVRILLTMVTCHCPLGKASYFGGRSMIHYYMRLRHRDTLLYARNQRLLYITSWVCCCPCCSVLSVTSKDLGRITNQTISLTD